MMLKQITFLAAVTMALPATAQRVGSNSLNNAPDSQWSVNYGNRSSLNSANLNYYNRSRFQLSPYMVYRPQNFVPRRVVGNVQPYSEVDYGRVVLATLDPADASPPADRVTGSGSILEQTTQTATGQMEVASTPVSDIIDRGILILPTREEVRLRGVIMPSETSTNEVDRLYAREAVNLIRQLVGEQEVTLSFGNPARDADGRILATVYLPDGTELNQMVLSRGYGRIRPEDFQIQQDFSALTAAQQRARDLRVGLWSKTP